MFCTLITTAKGLTSAIYSILNNKSPIYNTSAIKNKWEQDLGCTYDDVDWEFLLERAQRVLVSTKHRQMQFNIFHRTYFTPLRLHKIDNSISPMCQRCKATEGSLLHMLWSCPVLSDYWRFIMSTVSDIVESDIPHDPRIWLLGDVDMMNTTFNKDYFVLLASTAAKKIILVNWKSENSPSQKHWLNELASYCTPEKILYNVRRKPATFDKIWGRFLVVLPSISPLG